MTAKEIIFETVEFYRENPRSLDYSDPQSGPVCVYNGLNGTHCAYARLVKPELRPKLIEFSSVSSCGVFPEPNNLLEGYFIDDVNFYLFLQAIHDEKLFDITSKEELEDSKSHLFKDEYWDMLEKALNLS